MIRNILFILTLTLTFLSASGQNDEAYLKANAIRFDNPEKLSDSVYTLLSPFQVIMVGEMHGTNESAPFVKGLANLFTNKGDSVQVGLEITPELMNNSLQLDNDSSVYQSEFFANPPYLDGRESMAWAKLITSLNRNPKVALFFFDISRDEKVLPFRDSLMARNIKAQYSKHPTWKMITLSGNYHTSIANAGSMTSYFKRNSNAKICSLNMEYKEGTCMASFSGNFKKKELGSYPSVFNSTEGYDSYLLLYSPNQSSYEYNGIYYTKYITAASMVKDSFDLTAIKKQLSALWDRDQKTRTGADSAVFMSYIDSCNQVEVKSLIAKYGWMGKSLVGGRGNQAMFIVIQHADLAMQEKYFPLMQQSVDEGESRADEIAMLQDRILMREGKNQIYGSQVVYSKTGEQIFYPIEDEKNVNIRRAKVGLQPMEEYAKYFGIDYKLPGK